MLQTVGGGLAMESNFLWDHTSVLRKFGHFQPLKDGYSGGWGYQTPFHRDIYFWAWLEEIGTNMFDFLD